MVMRGRKRKGVRYYGPFGHAYAIRETLDLLLRTFPVRTCSDAVFRPPRAARPAVPEVPHRDSAAARASARSTRATTTASSPSCASSSTATPTPVVDRLEAEMREAADALEFERAARCRDRLVAVRKAIEKQTMVADRNEDLDVVAIADDDLEASCRCSTSAGAG